MEVNPVDERDVTIEDDHPVFRVYMWSQPFPNVHVPPERVGWWNYAYELKECDVHEAIAWAQDNLAEGGQYTLYVCYRREDGRLTAVRIAGTEPTRVDS
jgi:hypothetical protein